MVGDVPELLEKVKLLGWKVMATSGDRDLSIDRLIALTKLMDEKGIKVETHIGAGDHHGADIGDPSKYVYIWRLIMPVTCWEFSNPNREVLLTLSKSGVIELLGKEWYFVRVHDAIQVCLQHVQSLQETPNTSGPPPEEPTSFLQRLARQRGEDSSISELESGDRRPSFTKNNNPKLESLLSQKYGNIP
ncbi:hypothetical protein HS088_TW13G00614 [Tripterygium wilfordii]|uniref:Uncharacterized protein n=1 Tax=Tripterygium wilfordii TaxID=458696 RepID=A0A7J7CUC3_TRIWF|nr:hypothetical protein HS088_TW13G00614 [Tripterygium wilfordii]